MVRVELAWWYGGHKGWWFDGPVPFVCSRVDTPRWKVDVCCLLVMSLTTSVFFSKLFWFFGGKLLGSQRVGKKVVKRVNGQWMGGGEGEQGPSVKERGGEG